MRRRRETRHETLVHVSQALRIRAAYLKAIEDDDWRSLPNSVYARAFLRSYAVHLEADPERVLTLVETALESKPGPDTPLPPLPEGDRSLPSGALIGASVLLAIAVYAGWYYFSVERLRDERVVATMPDRLLMELTPAERASPVFVATPVQRVVQRERDPVLAADSADAANQAANRLVHQVTPGLPAVAAPAPGEASARERAASEGIVFYAIEPTYIELRSVETGEVLAELMLSTGELYRPPAGRGLVLSLGNAGGLEITVDGDAVAPLGPVGAVMRDIPIDRDLLLQGRAGG